MFSKNDLITLQGSARARVKCPAGEGFVELDTIKSNGNILIILDDLTQSVVSSASIVSSSTASTNAVSTGTATSKVSSTLVGAQSVGVSTAQVKTKPAAKVKRCVFSDPEDISLLKVLINKDLDHRTKSILTTIYGELIQES